MVGEGLTHSRCFDGGPIGLWVSCPEWVWELPGMTHCAPDPLCTHPWEILFARLLRGHFCPDLGVLRRPTELGGSVPFHLPIGLRLETKLSDFRTFHSGKNNCTWGKNTQTFLKVI